MLQWCSGQGNGKFEWFTTSGLQISSIMVQTRPRIFNLLILHVSWWSKWSSPIYSFKQDVSLQSGMFIGHIHRRPSPERASFGRGLFLLCFSRGDVKRSCNNFRLWFFNATLDSGHATLKQDPAVLEAVRCWCPIGQVTLPHKCESWAFGSFTNVNFWFRSPQVLSISHSHPEAMDRAWEKVSWQTPDLLERWDLQDLFLYHHHLP